MVLPVTVSVFRFASVATLGALVVSFGWDIAWLFVAVAVGLIIMGFGQALCLLRPGWHGSGD
jgi:hypothetical protein